MIEEFETSLNERFNACSSNIKLCFANNQIDEFDIEVIGVMLQEVKSVVSHKLFLDQYLDLKVR